MSRPTSRVGAAEHALYRLERYMRVRVTSGAFLYSSQALRKRAVCSVASAPSVPRRLWRPAGCARHISPPPSHRVRHGRARLKPFACGGFLVCNPLAAHHPVPTFVRRCTTVACARSAPPACGLACRNLASSSAHTHLHLPDPPSLSHLRAARPLPSWRADVRRCTGPSIASSFFFATLHVVVDNLLCAATRKVDRKLRVVNFGHGALTKLRMGDVIPDCKRTDVRDGGSHCSWVWFWLHACRRALQTLIGSFGLSWLGNHFWHGG